MRRTADIAWRTRKLVWKTWDGESIVFNPVSGNTHVLNSTAAEVLKALERQAATSFELSNQLACGFDFGFDTELCQNVEALIVQLDEMGLIEPVC